MNKKPKISKKSEKPKTVDIELGYSDHESNKQISKAFKRYLKKEKDQLLGHKREKDAKNELFTKTMKEKTIEENDKKIQKNDINNKLDNKNKSKLEIIKNKITKKPSLLKKEIIQNNKNEQKKENIQNSQIEKIDLIEGVKNIQVGNPDNTSKKEDKILGKTEISKNTNKPLKKTKIENFPSVKSLHDDDKNKDNLYNSLNITNPDFDFDLDIKVREGVQIKKNFEVKF